MRQVLALVVLLAGCGEGAVFEEGEGGDRVAQTLPQIEPFTTDGCSNFFDGIPFTTVKAWRHCCVIHDLAYWMGGTEGKKQAADQRLASCVNAAAGNPVIDLGRWMYRAVDTFGGPTWGPVRNTASWRWAYGWPEKESGFYMLTPYELVSVERGLSGVRLMLVNDVDAFGLSLTREQRDAIVLAIDTVYNVLGTQISAQP